LSTTNANGKPNTVTAAFSQLGNQII